LNAEPILRFEDNCGPMVSSPEILKLKLFILKNIYYDRLLG